MNFPLKKIHFIGIGGIGMCAIAEMLPVFGVAVQGSNNVENANIRRLQAKGNAGGVLPQRLPPGSSPKMAADPGAAVSGGGHGALRRGGPVPKRRGGFPVGVVGHAGRRCAQ